MKNLPVFLTLFVITICATVSTRAGDPDADPKYNFPLSRVEISYEPKVVHVGTPVTFTPKLVGKNTNQEIQWTGVALERHGNSMHNFKDIWASEDWKPTITYTKPGKKEVQISVCPNTYPLCIHGTIVIEVLP